MNKEEINSILDVSSPWEELDIFRYELDELLNEMLNRKDDLFLFNLVLSRQKKTKINRKNNILKFDDFVKLMETKIKERING